MTSQVEEAAIKLAVEAVRIAEKENVCLLCIIQRLFIRTEEIVEMGNLEHGDTRPSFDDEADVVWIGRLT